MSSWRLGFPDRYRRHPSRQERGRAMPVFIGAIVALGVVFIFAILGTISACSAPQKDTLVVGTNTPFPPFEQRNGEDVVGFDIDLAQAIAKALHRQLVIKDFSEFDALLPALKAGKLDMVVSAVTIRNDRDEVADFSDPYFTASQAILTVQSATFLYSGNPQNFAGKRIGYQEGTTSQFWIEENILGKVNIKSATPFGDIAVGLQLLRLGSFDLIIIDEPAAVSFAKLNPDLVISGTIETGEQYGVAVAQGDPQRFLPVVNKALRDMKERGEYEKLLEKWFGGGQ